MRFKVGSTVVVVQVYSGGNFAVGDIVKCARLATMTGMKKIATGPFPRMTG